MRLTLTCKLRKTFLAILVLGLVLSFTLSGCGQPSSDPQAQQIAVRTISAMNAAKSYKLNAYMTENYTVVEKSNPLITTEPLQWTSQRQVDMLNQEMYLSMDNSGSGATYAFEKYLVDGWEYYAQSSPRIGLTIPWIKTKLDQQYNMWSHEAQVTPQIELLKTAESISMAGTENVDGNDAYVINVVPSAEAAADWVLSQEQYSGPSVGWFRTSPERSREIYIKAYKDGFVRLWIDKDNDLILKVSVSLLFDGVPGNILSLDTGLEVTIGEDPTDVGFEHIIRDFNGRWEFSDYNKPVDIQLPEEALNAAE